jgi:hypothetical protein
MKRLVLIALIVCMCIGIVFTSIVLAKATFGSWKKWDESLPPWDNEDWVYSEESLKIISIPPVGGTRFWFWAEEQEQWRSIKVKNQPAATNVLFLLTCLVFKGNDQRAPITIFSPAPINKKVKGIEDALATAEIAIAAFPSSKGRVIIRSYEKKDGLLQFFKKWTIVCENGAVIPEKYEDWFINRFKQLTEENIEILPQLVVFKTGEKERFFIGVALPLFKKFLIKDKLPWIKEETTVVF